MGEVVETTIRVGRKTYAGKALLETDELLFRGDVRLTIPFKSVRSAVVDGDDLVVEHAEGRAVLALGKRAAAWATKIRSPKSVIEKLGVKAGQRVSVAGAPDDALARDLRAMGADVHDGPKLRASSDVVFLGVTTARDLARIATAAKALAPSGALWTIRRKGDAVANETAVRAAAHAAGLVDVKVVRYSEAHTAEKFVIPVAKRDR